MWIFHNFIVIEMVLGVVAAVTAAVAELVLLQVVVIVVAAQVAAAVVVALAVQGFELGPVEPVAQLVPVPAFLQLNSEPDIVLRPLWLTFLHKRNYSIRLPRKLQ